VQNLEYICKNFVDNFLKFLPGKRSLIIGNLSSNEYLKLYKQEMLDKGEKKVEMRALFKLREEGEFLIKSNNHDEFRKNLELKPGFDFVFSDNFRPVRGFSGLSSRNNEKDALEIEIDGTAYLLNAGLKNVLEQVGYANDNGVVAFLLEESALVETTLRRATDRQGLKVKLEDLLSDKGFYVNAILGIKNLESTYVNRDQYSLRDRKKSVFVFSKRKTESLFVADAGSESFNYNNLFDFLYGYSHSDISTNIDLENGCLLNKMDFHTYSGVQARSRIEEFKASYKDYKVVKLNDLMTGNVLSGSYEYDKVVNKKNNCIQLLFNFNSDADKIVTAELTPLSSHRRYFITLKDEVLSEYVAIFLQSKLGRSLYESYLTAGRMSGYELLEGNLIKIPIFIPNLNMQKQIIEAHNKIIKLQNSIDLFSDGLSSNPNIFLDEDIQKIDNMLDEVGKLNDADKIRSWICGFESKAVEFKQTWRLPTKGEKKQEFIDASKRINAVVFKVINSFINSSGGNLVIGVSDEKHEVVGIEVELEHYYKKISPIDKRVDKFDNAFKQSLDSAFTSDFIRLIDFHPVFLDGKIVYLVSCSPSDKACFIQDTKLKDDLNGNSFFVREGANSVPKSAEDLVIYCSNHFSSEL